LQPLERCPDRHFARTIPAKLDTDEAIRRHLDVDDAGQPAQPFFEMPRIGKVFYAPLRMPEVTLEAATESLDDFVEALQRQDLRIIVDTEPRGAVARSLFDGYALDALMGTQATDKPADACIPRTSHIR
jgi:hypothetical protein